MKGLEIARRYYETHGVSMIHTAFPEYADVIATGLVGEGSECLGYDDAVSQDHDFGPGFCLWLRESDMAQIGGALQAAYDALPVDFMGFSGRRTSPQADKRVGVFSIESFYSKYTNAAQAPVDALQWFKIPMHYLRTATNGAVFHDPLGRFTAIRTELLNYYPPDVVRKKLAAKVAVMAQAGQYNYVRAVQREDWGAAYLSAGEFVNATLAVWYLLNRVYMPFYKWAFRGTQDFAHGQACVADVLRFCTLPDGRAHAAEKCALIEKICATVADELRRQGYSNTYESFLQAQAEVLMARIADVRLRSLPIALDFD